MAQLNELYKLLGLLIYELIRIQKKQVTQLRFVSIFKTFDDSFSILLLDVRITPKNCVRTWRKLRGVTGIHSNLQKPSNRTEGHLCRKWHKYIFFPIPRIETVVLNRSPKASSNATAMIMVIFTHPSKSVAANKSLVYSCRKCALEFKFWIS